MTLQIPRVTIGDTSRSISIQFLESLGRLRPARMEIDCAGLQASWKTTFDGPLAFVEDLKVLYTTLQGEALLSDDDGVAVCLNVDSRGAVSVKVSICCQWAFGIDGDLRFVVHLDQSYLPDIIRQFELALASTEPEVAK